MDRKRKEHEKEDMVKKEREERETIGVKRKKKVDMMQKERGERDSRRKKEKKVRYDAGKKKQRERQ